MHYRASSSRTRRLASVGPRVSWGGAWQSGSRYHLWTMRTVPFSMMSYYSIVLCAYYANWNRWKNIARRHWLLTWPGGNHHSVLREACIFWRTSSILVLLCSRGQPLAKMEHTASRIKASLYKYEANDSTNDQKGTLITTPWKYIRRDDQLTTIVD